MACDISLACVSALAMCVALRSGVLTQRNMATSTILHFVQGKNVYGWGVKPATSSPSLPSQHNFSPSTATANLESRVRVNMQETSGGTGKEQRQEVASGQPDGE